MPLAPLESMTFSDIIAYVELLENENRRLTKKTDNRKKLTRSEVSRIRSLYDSGAWTQAELAKAFMVNASTISRIVRGHYHGDN